MYMVGGRSGERKVDDLALERGAGRLGFDDGPRLATELDRCTGATWLPLGKPPFWIPLEVAFVSTEGRLRVPLEFAECRKLGRGEAWGAALVYCAARCNKSIWQNEKYGVQ